MVAIRIEQVAYRYCVPRETIYNTRIGSTNRVEQMNYQEFKTVMNELHYALSALRGDSKSLLDNWNTRCAIDDVMDGLTDRHPRMYNRYCDEL